MTPSIAVQPSQKAEQRPLLKGSKILVIDTDEEVRNNAHNLLERYGCVVETAHEGQEALNMICNSGENYDAIIADIRLPEMNGYELLMQLKEQLPDPPLILMTGFGYDPGHAIVKARREGLRPNAILYKPFRLDQLLKRSKQCSSQPKARHNSASATLLTLGQFLYWVSRFRDKSPDLARLRPIGWDSGCVSRISSKKY